MPPLPMVPWLFPSGIAEVVFERQLSTFQIFHGFQHGKTAHEARHLEVDVTALQLHADRDYDDFLDW